MLKTLIKWPLYSFLLVFSTLSSQIDASQGIEHRQINVPMRDGVELETDLYLPKDQKEPLPCILLRTPYNREHYKKTHANMARMGYVVAIQSVRSATHAEEFPEPYIQDAWGTLQDGYDTIKYLGESDFTNGNIGTFGASAMGIVQLLTAPTRPPHLKCQWIQVATPSLYHHAAYIGGKLCKHQIESWFLKVAPLAYQHMIEHRDYDAYWEQIDASKKAEYVQTPALHYGGWYDIFSQGTIDAFTSWQNQGGVGAKGKQRLIMGPWTHWGLVPDKLGEFDIPESSMTFSESEMIANWFDYHLKGDTSALDDQPPIMYYTMGPLDGTASKGNVWKSSLKWPPPSKEQVFYLSNSFALTQQKPMFSSRRYKYNYDAENPVPTVGGRNLYLDSGPYDQSLNERRDDVLVFSTDALEQDTEITGRISATVYVSSSASSTDVALTLTDVYPDGKSVLISEGIQHVQCPDNKVVRVEVDLWSTSMVFAKGHKIRLNIAASNYPHFDKNEESAQNVLHVGTKYPSHVLLPEIVD